MNRCYFFHLSDLSITSGKEKYGEGLLWEFSFSWLTHVAAVLKQRSFATPPTQWIGCRISQWHFWIMPLGAGDDSTWNSAALCGVLRQPVCLWLHKAGCHLYEYKYNISGSSEEKNRKTIPLSSEKCPHHVGAALPAWCIFQSQWSALFHGHLCFSIGWRLGSFLINVMLSDVSLLSGVQFDYP